MKCGETSRAIRLTSATFKVKIVLIGFMGAGKSSVGRLLAKKLDWPFFDTDEMVEKQVGKPVPVIIRLQGEAAFRKVEKEAVRLVALSDKCVISTGGGVPLDEDNMNELRKDAVVLWLKVSPETVMKRIRDVSARPLIDPSNPLDSIQARLADREAAYGKATRTVETDGLSKEEVVEKIMAVLPVSS